MEVFVQRVRFLQMIFIWSLNVDISQDKKHLRPQLCFNVLGGSVSRETVQRTFSFSWKYLLYLEVLGS